MISRNFIIFHIPCGSKLRTMQMASYKLFVGDTVCGGNNVTLICSLMLLIVGGQIEPATWCLGPVI
jgi:hypothetical protein